MLLTKDFGNLRPGYFCFEDFSHGLRLEDQLEGGDYDFTTEFELGGQMEASP